MTPKQNLLAVLSGGNPAWMPACVHIANANNLPGFLPRQLLREPLDRLRVAEFVGGDILHEIKAISPCLPSGCKSHGERIGNRQKRRLSTPAGELTEELLLEEVATPVYSERPAGQVMPGPINNSVHTRFMVDRPEAYQILTDYYEGLSYTVDHSLIERESRRVGQRGLVVLGGGPSSPLYSLISSLAGIERVSYDLFDLQVQVETTMQAMQRAASRWYRVAATTDCEVIRCTEDLDTKLISPAMFRQYAVPALTEYARICHEQGKIFILHMCGHIREFLPDLSRIRVDGLHCLTLPPIGNTTVAEARRELAGTTAPMFRPNAEVLLNGSLAEINQEIDQICQPMEDWHNGLVIIPCGRAAPDKIRHAIKRVHQQTQWS